MKKLLLLLTLFTTPAFSGSKVCLPNDAGGLIVLTHEECRSDIIDHKLFPYHAYATEANGTRHTGCFDIPVIPDNVEKKPGMRIIPLVNFKDGEDGQIITFHAEWFTSESCKLHTEI